MITPPNVSENIKHKINIIENSTYNLKQFLKYMLTTLKMKSVFVNSKSCHTCLCGSNRKHWKVMLQPSQLYFYFNM